jgi:hypothetical protein|nr:MAG TPA: hypothetical protein [Caudoviricetes sp.]
MERLTKYDTDGQAMMDCQKCEADWTGKHGKPMADCTALYCRNRLLDRLVKYEDTERTPEEIDMDHEAAEQLRHLCRNCDLDRLEKLAEADRDGRVVVRPCKVGDTLFRVFAGEILEHRVGSMKYFAIQGRWDIETYPFCPCVESSIGKTIFLTREEAKKALEAK